MAGGPPPPLPEPRASFAILLGGQVLEMRRCPACEHLMVVDPRTGRTQCGGPTRCRRVRESP